MNAVVQVRDVTKSYRRGTRSVPVLGGLTLDVADGDFLALMGPSGSGKTTLLNLIGGLDRPDSGRIVVAGQDITGASSGALARWRARHIGFVFQFYNLLPVLSGREKRRAAAAARLASRDRRASASGRAPRWSWSAWPIALDATMPSPAFRRARAAGRHRPGDRQRSDAVAVRRADRRSRPRRPADEILDHARRR